MTAVNVELWIMAAATYSPLPCRILMLFVNKTLAHRSHKPVYIARVAFFFIARFYCANHHTKNYFNLYVQYVYNHNSITWPF